MFRIYLDIIWFVVIVAASFVAGWFVSRSKR